MPGAIVIVVVLVFAIPISVALGGAVIAGVLGWSLKDTSEKDHEGSELLDLNT